MDEREREMEAREPFGPTSEEGALNRSAGTESASALPAEGEPGEIIEIPRINRSRRERIEGQAPASVFDRTGEGLIRFMGRIPLLNRLPLDRLNPRAVSVATLVVMVLLGSLTVFAFSVNDPVAQQPVKADRPVAEKPPEKPPEPAMFVLRHQGKKWEIDLRSIGYDGKDAATVDREKLVEWLEQVKEEVDEPAVNARMRRWGAPIRPSKEGHRMDLKKIEEEWLPHLSDYINRPQEIPMIVEKPQVTEADLRAVNQRRIGRYTTYFDGSNVNRTTNIRLSAQAIHNLVLNPGESFSFNRVVGPRTPERGYKSATVIVRGEYSEGIGGGICQTSSTLYNSVDQAGLRIIARYSHSKEVTYVPAGRDATVSWGGPDFKFINNLEKPILIKTYVGDGFITVSIYTTPDAEVSTRAVPPAPKRTAKQIQVKPDKPSEDLNGGESPGTDQQGDQSGDSSGSNGNSSGSGAAGGDSSGNTGGDPSGNTGSDQSGSGSGTGR